VIEQKMHYMAEKREGKRKRKRKGCGRKKHLPAWPRGETPPGYAISFGLPGRGESRRDISGLYAGDC